MTIKDVERVLRNLRKERKRDEARPGGSVMMRDGRILRIYSICLREDEMDELEAAVKLARRLLRQEARP